MARNRPDDLVEVLRQVELGELFSLDLGVAVLVGAAGGWLGAEHFDVASAAAGTAANLIGVVVGTVVAALAIISAFMGPELLRKLELLDRDPVYYLGPFLITAVLGVAAAFATIALAATPLTADDWVHVTVAAAAGFFTAWTLGSLLHSLSTLVQFVRYQAEAAQVTEEDVAAFKRRREVG